MEEDSNDLPRVTRARTRRMSALDTDTRPLTPLLDTQPDRASPRPLRRTRLNSATTDLRTPTRATRASVARGETPEPVTPITLSAAKRSTRTPAKSARKQLVLKEEDIAEQETEQPKRRFSNERPKSATESPKSANTSGRRSVTPLNSEERRVTRSMSKTPPVVGGLVVNNISQPKFDMDTSLEEKEKHVEKNKEEKQTKVEVIDKKERENAAEVVEESVVEAKSTPKVDEDLSDNSLISTSIKKSLNTPKVQIKVKDVLLEKKQTVNGATPKVKDLDAESEQEMAETVTNDDALADEQAQLEKKETPRNARSTTSKIPIPSSKENDATEKNEEVMPVLLASEEQSKPTKASTEPENTNKVETPISPTGDDADAKQASPEVTESVKSKDSQILEDVRLTDLTPRTISRVVKKPKPTSEGRKTVAFNSDSPIVEVSKPTFPKTPARINASPAEIVNIKPEFNIKIETPVKSFLKGRRNSSTPLAKLDAPKPKADEEESIKLLPKIDLIGSLASLESKEKEEDIVAKKEISLNVLVSGSEEEEDSLGHEDKENEHDEEDEDEGANCMFVDNEVEVVENYQSGDSMDSSDRREIKENEIPHDGESVGSQDTDEELSEDDEDDEKMSFIVSDDDVEDGDSRNNSLRFSTAEEDDFIDNDGKGPKKRRRIIVNDSSDDSVVEDNKNKKFKVSIEDEEEHSESLETSKEDSVAEQNNDKSTVENKMIKSSELDKTASPKSKVEDVHNEVTLEEDVHFVPSSPEMSCDEETSKNKSSNDKTIYEVFDSAEETEEESTKDNSMPSAEETKQPENESDTEKSDKENPISKDVETNAEQVDKVVETEVAEADSVAQPIKKQCKSSANESEAALLSELASCDLSHLKKMFNPLQKSRRQTLYVQGSEAVVTEPKPKASRRSEHLNIDFKPSQSFIETLEEKKRLQTKRTRISKSFCSAADDLNDSTMEEVQCKKSKKNDESQESPEEPIMPDMKSPESPVVEKEEPLQKAELTQEDQAKQQEPKPEDQAKQQESKQEDQAKQQEKPKQLPKTAAEYLDYCDTILQAANEAKLKQKKQRIAEGKQKAPKKRLLPDAKPADVVKKTLKEVEHNQEDNNVKELKKNVKRLQATKHAVKQAIQILVPLPTVKNESKSLTQKLSRQPENKGKVVVKPKAQGQKNNTKNQSNKVDVSPGKSSDEENHSTIRIKTTAGYAVESLCDQDEFTTFNNRAGPVQVEPSTPKQKYFKEIPPTPHHSWFKELPCTPKGKREKNSNPNPNAAKSSALRFKREIFGRNRK